MTSRHLLQVINLGKRSFADALRAQEVIRQRVIAQASGQQPASSSQTTHNDYYPGEPADFLLLVEHWPTFTAGENQVDLLSALTLLACSCIFNIECSGVKIFLPSVAITLQKIQQQTSPDFTWR